MAESERPVGLAHMSVEKEDVKLRDVDKNAIKMLASYLKKHRLPLLLALLCMLVVAVANMASPYLSKIAIDDYIANRNISGLVKILAAYIAVYAVFWGASYAGTYTSRKVGQRVIAEVRHDLMRHVVDMPMSFFTANRTGEIMSRLTGDVNNLAELITNGIVNIFGDCLTLVGITVMMFFLNAKLAAISLVVIPIIYFGLDYIGSFMRKAYGSMREVSGKMTAGVEENLSGIRVVKSMSQETANEKSFEKLNADTFKAQIRASGANALIFPFMSFVSSLSTALVVIFGGLMILEGERGATVGLVMAFIGYTNRFFTPVRDISQVYGVYQNAAASAERIYKYLQMPVTIKSPEKPAVLNFPVKGDISFDRVCFGYEPGKSILEDFSLELPAGQVTAVVGPTGAGKSTLIRLVARLYDVTGGTVRIDGTDVRDIMLEALRESVLLVPQEVVLFNTTIRENIRYGRPEASDCEVERAAAVACADSFIEKLPKGYETRVGEAGGLLSGGQRQLIAFARAVLADRPILILDEATSSVDAATEVLIQKALDNLMEGRTVIIIAHRFTTLRNTQRVLVMNGGKAVGYGTHNELLENNGLYRELFERQWMPAINSGANS
ncbi:MAG: ABC transporter ATP-binding protein [Clostridia bacterium]|nr:ABC transporter ATP-binding protein [Clostridia bacterium]